MSEGTTSQIEVVWRAERARIVASLARRLGDLQLAEDAVQEAFAAATLRWPVDGLPDRPGAWLTTTAWRKALDVIRRERFPLGHQADNDTTVESPTVAAWVEDDVLGLVMACCHPALSIEARVALTLRHIAGLTSRQIAAAFLVPEATMDKRLVRARAKIRDAGIRFGLPDKADLGERLAGVHAVIYLVFTEGHLATDDGPAVRADLCGEAVWLATQVQALTPRDPESAGLLALLLILQARLGGRSDAQGRLVPFDEQDPNRWDTTAIARARAVLTATPSDALGPYQVEAAIALLHASAPDHVNWPRIAELYAVLNRLTPSPVIEVNRAVAEGHAHGPKAGLDILAPIFAAGQLATYPALHAAHADLLERTSSYAEAAQDWQTAAEASANPAQRSELLRRATEARGRVRPVER